MKHNKYIDENLIYILENTTPYQRMVWLKKAFNFWKLSQKNRKSLLSRPKGHKSHHNITSQ